MLADYLFKEDMTRKRHFYTLGVVLKIFNYPTPSADEDITNRFYFSPLSNILL